MERNSVFKCQGMQDLAEYLLVKTAPVIMGVKPALLLRLTKCARLRNSERYDVFCLYGEEMLSILKLKAVILKESATDLQILFYEERSLQKILCRSENRNFLNLFGYESCRNVEEFLEHLRLRFSGMEFPHEIGLFLGYPKKDVEGFIRSPGGGRCVPRGLWRVFGPMGESMVKMNCFRFAERAAEHALRECCSVPLCVDKIKSTDLRMAVSF